MSLKPPPNVRLAVGNTKDLLNDLRIREPWPDSFIDWNKPRDAKLVDELARILAGAADERPLQEFYTAHPYLLALSFPCHCCWVFPKPRLGGGKLVPDFLYCDLNSLGHKWTLIELESPRMEATNRDGSVSRDCHHAVQQILDYRRWLRDNALFEEKQGFRGLNSDCEGYVVIGRRDAGRTDLERQRLADFRVEKIEIASYDRLLSQASDHLTYINRQWKDAAELAKKVRAVKK